MAKGYEENEQAFGVGDVVLLDNYYTAKVENVIEDEDGNYRYDVVTIVGDIKEVPQHALESI